MIYIYRNIKGSKLISVFNDIITQFSESHKKFKLPCFIIALTDDIEKLSTSIQSLFRYQFKIDVIFFMLYRLFIYLFIYLYNILYICIYIYIDKLNIIKNLLNILESIGK